MIGRKYILGATTEQLVRRHGKETLRSRTDHHSAAIQREQDQAIVQAAQNLIEIFAQRAENLADSAQLHSDLADFGAHLSEFVAGFQRLLIEFAF